MTFTCPVCGYPALAEPHVDPTGSPTYSICPCCGVHFGADDVDSTHADLRQKWIEEGAEWWSMNEKAPDGWNAQAQLDTAFGEAKAGESSGRN
jgi:transcription elongation factor Elf1